MASFQFTAVRAGGERFTDVREAEDKHALVKMLEGEGVTALEVEEVRGKGKKGKSSALSSFNIDIPFLSGVPQAEKIIFARNLSAMITAGLSLSRALSVLEKQTRQSTLKKTVAAINEDVRQGHALHEALSRHPKVFSSMFCAMARAGEESGTLAQSLQVVATQMERSYTLTKKVRGAMLYPAIVVTVMLVIGVLMLIYVVPTLSETFASLDSELPFTTRMVLLMSGFFISHSILVGSAAIGLVSLFIFAIRTAVGKRVFDFVLLYMPIVGKIIAKVNAARTARTLSSLLSAGVSALAALDITASVVQNTRFRPVIQAAHDLVEKGRPVSEAFVHAENIYPVMFAEMASVGEETGDIAGMLGRVAEYYENEVEQETKDLSTAIEPIIMVIIGGAVAFFALAMVMPIYSLSNSI